MNELESNPIPQSERHQEALNRFINFWSEMASNWGINRTMAQIHALLYALEEAVDTDYIMDRLQISRGNANMNLRSLINWNLVRKVHIAGSRKDFFIAEKDVWEITIQIIRERERREIQPVMQQLQGCREILAGRVDGPCPDGMSTSERHFCERLDNLVRLMEVFEGLSRTLLPFIQMQNMDMLRQLVGLTGNESDSKEED
jgi:DNA-binding transcriptional regulator GbsR (MarR family)